MTESSSLNLMRSASSGLGGDGSHLGAPGLTVDVCGTITHDLLRTILLELLLSADLGISYYLSLFRVMVLVVVPPAILG